MRAHTHTHTHTHTHSQIQTHISVFENTHSHNQKFTKGHRQQCQSPVPVSNYKHIISGGSYSASCNTDVRVRDTSMHPRMHARTHLAGVNGCAWPHNETDLAGVNGCAWPHNKTDLAGVNGCAWPHNKTDLQSDKSYEREGKQKEPPSQSQSL